MKENANKGLGGLLGAAPIPKRRRLVEFILGAYLLIAGYFYFGLRLGRYAESLSVKVYHHGEAMPAMDQRFLLYYSHSGFGNQLICLHRAAIFALATNRTLVLPPVLPHLTFRTKRLRFSRYKARSGGNQCRAYDGYQKFVKRVYTDAKGARDKQAPFPSFLELFDFDDIESKTGLRVVDMGTFMRSENHDMKTWCTGEDRQIAKAMVSGCDKGDNLTFPETVSRFQDACNASERVAAIGSPFVMPWREVPNGIMDTMTTYVENEMLPSHKMLLLLKQMRSNLPERYSGVALRFQDKMKVDDCDAPLVREGYETVLATLATAMPIKNNATNASATDSQNAIGSNLILLGSDHKAALRCFRHHIQRGNYTARVQRVSDILDNDGEAKRLFDDVQSEGETASLLLDQFLIGMSDAVAFGVIHKGRKGSTFHNRIMILHQNKGTILNALHRVEEANQANQATDARAPKAAVLGNSARLATAANTTAADTTDAESFSSGDNGTALFSEGPVLHPMENTTEVVLHDEDSEPNKCANGPYVFDPHSHREGIGSTFNHRKYGLILADAFNASWIGELYNGHETEGANHALSYFGLGDLNCGIDDLKAREDDLDFVHFHRPIDHAKMPKEKKRKLFPQEYFAQTGGDYQLPSTKSLCQSVENGRMRMPWMKSNTVIVLNHKAGFRATMNYCVFNRRFRQRFARRQRERKVRTKGQDDLWISIHFRWGDVAEESVESPNKRAGGVGLSGYINETRFQLDKQRGQNKTITLHFFSEGDKATFSKFDAAFPDAEMHINGDWRESLDLMTQSDVLIGGQSGFFNLAAHLCDGCTVVTTSPAHKKYRASSVERKLTNYRPVIGFSAGSEYS